MISTNILVCQSADGTKKGEISWQNFSGVRGESERDAARGERRRAQTGAGAGKPRNPGGQRAPRARGKAAQSRGKGMPRAERDRPKTQKAPRATRRPGGLRPCGRKRERTRPRAERRMRPAAAQPMRTAAQQKVRAARTLFLMIHHFCSRRKGKCAGAAHTKSRAAAAAAARKSLWITGTTPRPDP